MVKHVNRSVEHPGDEPRYEHVLIVEDDELLRKLVVLMISGLGYKVSEAEDGPKALNLIRLHPDIDLVFTDIMMPGAMSGYDLAEKARQLRPDLPILFTSGQNSELIAFGDRRDPDLDIVRKPYGDLQLAQRIREMLDGERQG